MIHSTDIAVIGAGPVGLFFVFEAGMLKMNCHVIDALDFPGGQCTALYPEKPIYDIPGYPEIEAAELIAKLETQSSPFSPQYHLGQRVEKLQKTADGYMLTTSKDTQISCKAVVIAAGCGAFGPNRPPLEGIEEFEGKSVFYMVSRKEDFRGKKVAIAGGGDSAIDWAIILSSLAEKVYFIHRRPKFRAAPESVARLEKLANDGKVEMVIPYQLDELHGENGDLKQITLKTLEGTAKTIDADVLLPFFGLSMELGPIADWSLNLDMNHISVDPLTAATNQPGIFAIGDIATYPRKLKLILSGFHEAAMAAHSIHPIVHPDVPLHFEYSTSKGVPA
jgi:thioredoxin reductase (NADPH)